MKVEEKFLAEVDECEFLYKIHSAWPVMAFSCGI